MKIGMAIALFVAGALVLGACGGGDDDEEATASATTTEDGPGTSVTPEGPPLSDVEYLKVFCTGVTNYREALNTEQRDGLIRVVQDYLDSMAAVNPPEDLREFHTGLLSYLEDALEEPTYLITRNPPVPEEEVRARMASTAEEVDECQYPVFVGGQ